MSVCAAAPSPCLPPRNVESPKRRIAETSNRRNVESPKRRIAETSNSRNVHPVSLRFVDSTFRRIVESAAKRLGGKAFRRQRFSPFRLHVVGLSGRLFGATRDSADRRPTLDAETLKRTKRAKRRKDRASSKSEHPRGSTWSN